MTADAPSEGAVLVLEGTINPGIISVAWLLAHEVVTKQQALDATTHFQDPDLSRFEVGGRIVEARRDQLTVASAPELLAFQEIGHFTTQILELLPHTPITALGMNRVSHSPLMPGGFADLSGTLAPRVPWDGILRDPTVASLTMRSGGRKKGDPNIEVTVEPSAINHGGVYVVAAQRLESDRDPGVLGGAGWVLEQIGLLWEVWMDEASTLIDLIVRRAWEER